MSQHSASNHGPVVEMHGAGHAHDHGHGEHGHGDHSHGGHEAHSVGIAKYIYVFIALCLLTGASFFTQSDWWKEHFSPQVSWAFMMAVSCTKAMLVILFFMHILYEANWKFVLTIPAALMSVFLVLMLIPDVGMRSRTVSEERAHHMAKPKTADTSQAHTHAPAGAGSHP
jgi:cytochrome c oxidase subunit 4